MGCASNNGGISLGRCPATPHSRSGSDLRHQRHTPIARHGHPGQTYCTSLALAERLCRTADRIDPARVCGPFRRLGRGASAPNPASLCSLLQRHPNAPVIGQRCAGLSPRSPHRSHWFTRDPWRTSSPLRADLGFRYTQREAVRLGVARLVLISGLGADPQSRSPYIRSRGRGELAVQQAFPDATIVRPSAMFGPGDALFGTLANLARLLPVLPLIGGGRTRLQPVYVEDVAEAVARILADPGTVGRTYELAGPEVYTLRDLVRFTLRVIGKRRLLMPLPFAVAEIQARIFELLPSPPLTTGQVDLLKADSVAGGALPGLRELNIPPKAVEEVVPTYISRSLSGV